MRKNISAAGKNRFYIMKLKQMSLIFFVKSFFTQKCAKPLDKFLLIF